MHLFILMSPAMGKLILLMVLAMMPGAVEARCSLKRFDENMQKILGLFGDDYLTASDEFVNSLDK